MVISITRINRILSPQIPPLLTQATLGHMQRPRNLIKTANANGGHRPTAVKTNETDATSHILCIMMQCIDYLRINCLIVILSFLCM